MDALEYVDGEFPWHAVGGTDRAYLGRVRMLVLEFEVETGELWSKDVEGFVTFLARRADSLSKSAWRQYRASLTRWIGPRAPAWFVNALQGIHGAAGGRAGTPKGRKRIKKLPEDEFTQLMEAAAESGASSWRKVAAVWLWVGSVTGLRPCEWWAAQMQGDWLVVENAKYGVDGDGRSARAFGPRRSLYLGALPQEEREAIDAFFKRVVAQYRAEHTRKQAMQALSRLQKRLWPRRKVRRCHLYSARHQFTADLKAAGCSREKIAALVGHGSIDTAESHYGES